MFAALGRMINHNYVFALGGWLVLFFVLRWAAPPWSQVAKDGQFSFLPPDSPSRRGDELFNAAFPVTICSLEQHRDRRLAPRKRRWGSVQGCDLRFIY